MNENQKSVLAAFMGGLGVQTEIELIHALRGDRDTKLAFIRKYSFDLGMTDAQRDIILAVGTLSSLDIELLAAAKIGAAMAKSNPKPLGFFGKIFNALFGWFK